MFPEKMFLKAAIKSENIGIKGYYLAPKAPEIFLPLNSIRLGGSI